MKYLLTFLALLLASVVIDLFVIFFGIILSLFDRTHKYGMLLLAASSFFPKRLLPELCRIPAGQCSCKTCPHYVSDCSK